MPQSPDESLLETESKGAWQSDKAWFSNERVAQGALPSHPRQGAGLPAPVFAPYPAPVPIRIGGVGALGPRT